VLRTMIISPDTAMAEHLGQTLAEMGEVVRVCKLVARYPNVGDLTKMLRAHAPELIFLSFENTRFAVDTVRLLETQAVGVQIIAIHTMCDATLLRESMRVGVREFLTDPFDPGSIADALRNVKMLLDKKPPLYETTNQVFSFLPSKAGVGTTTLALNISAALARARETNVLLTDMDLNSGMLRFLLKLKTEYSLVDAVENGNDMDETVWPQLITEQGNVGKGSLDVLHAGRVNPNLRIDPQQVRCLLQFMKRNYQTLVFDHSGNLERYSLEVMQESRHIFVVCTPEIPSLHLAREKMGFLKAAALDTKVSLMLTRIQKKSLFTTAQVEELVGAKVVANFSNDYFAVSRATTAGLTLDPESLIGQQCARFASGLENRGKKSAEDRKRSFLEFFKVTTTTAQVLAQE
jgi:pilus assembly protein CpaE